VTPNERWSKELKCAVLVLQRSSLFKSSYLQYKRLVRLPDLTKQPPSKRYQKLKAGDLANKRLKN